MLTCILLLITREREAFKVRFQANSNQLMQCEERSALSWFVRGQEDPAPLEQSCGGESRVQGSRVGCDHGDLEKPVDLRTDNEELLHLVLL